MRGRGIPRPTRLPAAAPPPCANHPRGCAEEPHLKTTGGVSLERLLHGTYPNGDAMIQWVNDDKHLHFHHRFDATEVGRVDGGVATITPTDGMSPPFIIGPGDVFELGAEFDCWFTVHETLKKTLGYLDRKGEIEYNTTTITCDKCETALEADVPWYREANPKGGAPDEWCERCFQTTRIRAEGLHETSQGQSYRVPRETGQWEAAP
jgi:hypothetical protein